MWFTDLECGRDGGGRIGKTDVGVMWVADPESRGREGEKHRLLT